MTQTFFHNLILLFFIFYSCRAAAFCFRFLCRVTSGFRTIGDVDMIQFTAPISSGSSGGAVLNMQGEIIGISTAGFDSGQNINLAVDYRTVAAFVRGFV